jgi:hypothetical protein
MLATLIQAALNKTTWKVVTLWKRVKVLNQITKNRTEAIAVRKGKQNRANAKSNLEDEAWETKIVIEVKFPVGKSETMSDFVLQWRILLKVISVNAIAVTLGVQCDQYYRVEMWHNFSPETSFAFALRECLKLRKYQTARYLCGNMTGNCPYQEVDVNRYFVCVYIG